MPDRLAYLMIDFNSYFASVEQQLQPHLRGRPVAVLPVESDSTCAIAASYEAKAYGIKTGTPVWEAKQRCRSLVCVPARHRLYLDYHERLLVEISRHASVWGVESIDEVSCYLSPLQQSEEAARALARRIKRGIAERVGEHLTCSIGLSTNRFLAKVGTDMQKPDGLVVLYPEEVPSRLGHRPITDLPGIGANMDHRLRMRGVGTIGELWRRSPREMRRLWGSVEGERMWHKLHGIELPYVEAERRVIGHSHILDPIWRPFPLAEAVARRLLLKAASRLRRHELYASALGLAIRIEDGPRLQAACRLPACCDNWTLQRSLSRLWQSFAEARPDAPRIKKVSVQLHELSPARPADGLFDEQDEALQARLRQEKTAHAMDRLNRRYGLNTVVMGFLPRQTTGFSGTKIAFTRIPHQEEFHE